MAISTYAELQAAFTDYLARDDISGNATTAIALAEARLNRLIPAVETDAALTGTLDSRRIDVDANNVVSPIALFLVDPSTSDEEELTQRSDGSFPYDDTSGRPRFWAMDGDEAIDFDCPLDQAYSFRLRFRQQFTLSDAAPTNWLLTKHPDVYLAATLMWGGVFTQDSGFGQTFSAILDRGIPSVKSIIASGKKGILTVDPALRGRRSHYDGINDI